MSRSAIGIGIGVGFGSSVGVGLGGAAAPSTTGKLAANRTQIPTNIGSDVTASVPITYRRAHYAHPAGAISALQPIDLHWYYDTTNCRETTPGGTVTIKRYFEYPSGTYHQVLWAGSPTVTIANGGQAKSDPVAGLTIPASAQFWERTVITAVTGTGVTCLTQMPANHSTLGLTDGSAVGFDYGNTAGTFSTGSANTVGCAAIVGTVAGANARSVVLVGDSIIWGAGDISGVGAKGGSGWSGRMFDPLMPWVKMAKPNQRLDQWLFSTARAEAFLAAIDYTEAVMCHGVNDLSDGIALATIQSQYATLAALLNKGGSALIHQATLLPQTSTTDGWATTANQTILTGGNRAFRPDLNDWERADPAYQTGQVIDIADAAMTARNSEIWKAPPANTADGIHPNTAGATLIASTAGAAFV
jgi:lysophospholipase L1-like esterase